MKININKYSDLELALMVLLNYFGTGAKRKEALGDRFTKVQSLVNQIVNGYMPDSYYTEYDKKITSALIALKPSDKDYDAYIDSILSYIKEDTHK